MVLPLLVVLLSAQQSGQSVLDSLNAKLRKAKTLQTELVINPDQDATRFDISLSKPGSYLVQAKSQGFVRDGKVERLWFTSEKTYYELPLSNPPAPPFLCVGLEAFFDEGKTFHANSIEPATLDGALNRKLVLSKAGVPGMHWGLYLDGKGLPAGWEQKADDTKLVILQARYKNLRLDGDLAPSVFDWSPTGYRLETKFGAQIPTMAVGDLCPPATAVSLTGKRADLRAMFSGKKAILLNFWFVGCAPCRHEFPYLQQLHRRFGNAGLAVIGVDRGDSAEQVRAYVEEQKGSFAILLDPSGKDVAEKFKVNAFPTTYILSPDGQVLSVIVGEDRAKLDSELAKLGFVPSARNASSRLVGRRVPSTDAPTGSDPS